MKSIGVGLGSLNRSTYLKQDGSLLCMGSLWGRGWDLLLPNDPQASARIVEPLQGIAAAQAFLLCETGGRLLLDQSDFSLDHQSLGITYSRFACKVQSQVS